MSILNKNIAPNERLSVQAAVALACNELGIGQKDRADRETIAILMAPLAQARHATIQELKLFATSQFRRAL